MTRLKVYRRTATVERSYNIYACFCKRRFHSHSRVYSRSRLVICAINIMAIAREK